MRRICLIGSRDRYQLALRGECVIIRISIIFRRQCNRLPHSYPSILGSRGQNEHSKYSSNLRLLSERVLSRTRKESSNRKKASYSYLYCSSINASDSLGMSHKMLHTCHEIETFISIHDFMSSFQCHPKNKEK